MKLNAVKKKPCGMLKNVKTEAEHLKSRMNTLDTNYVNEYSNRVETQMGTAEQALARAIEIGDTNGVVEAQRKITKLAIENDRAQPSQDAAAERTLNKAGSTASNRFSSLCRSSSRVDPIPKQKIGLLGTSGLALMRP